jgi:hypothetical protein
MLERGTFLGATGFTTFDATGCPVSSKFWNKFVPLEM